MAKCRGSFPPVGTCATNVSVPLRGIDRKNRNALVTAIGAYTEISHWDARRFPQRHSVRKSLRQGGDLLHAAVRVLRLIRKNSHS